MIVLRLALLPLLCSSAFAQQIVAHRGASHDAPENTLAAFRLAFEQGADAIEGDFRLTADGEIVCIHDGDTQKTAGVAHVVADTTLAQLRTLDVGAWKAQRFEGERIPTLAEVLGVLPADKVLLIELKSGSEIVPPLVRVLAAADLAPAQLRIIAFDAEVIAACKRSLPAIEAYWLTGHERGEDGRWSNPIEEVLPTLERIGADGLDTSVPAEVVDADFVAGLRAAGMQFHAWTVNDAATAARLYWLGVDSITTDRPAYLRSLLPRIDLRTHVALHLPCETSAEVSLASPTWVRGVYGRAWTDATARVERPLPERGTLAFWYQPRGWYDYQTLFDTPAHENGWELWIYADARLRFRAHPEGMQLTHAFHPTGDADEWHHIALAWDRTDTSARAVRLYVNGHLADAGAWSGRGWFEAGPSFTLGGGHAGNTHGRGAFDEVVLLDVPLEERDVRFLMGAALGD